MLAPLLLLFDHLQDFDFDVNTLLNSLKHPFKHSCECVGFSGTRSDAHLAELFYDIAQHGVSIFTGLTLFVVRRRTNISTTLLILSRVQFESMYPSVSRS